MREKLVIIRGAGDLATGVAQSLYEAGFRLLLLEVDFFYKDGLIPETCTQAIELTDTETIYYLW